MHSQPDREVSDYSQSSKTNIIRVTRNGKIALIGIVVGFLVSGSITVKEHIKSVRDEYDAKIAAAQATADIKAAYEKGQEEMRREYSSGVRKGLQPLGNYHVELRVNYQDGFVEEEDLREFLLSLPKVQGQAVYGSIQYQKLPPILRKGLESWGGLNGAANYVFLLYHSGSNCKTRLCLKYLRHYPKPALLITIQISSLHPTILQQVQQHPSALKDDQNSWLNYEDGHIQLNHAYDLDSQRTSDNIASVDDLLGSTVIAMPDSDLGRKQSKRSARRWRLDFRKQCTFTDWRSGEHEQQVS